LGRGGSHVVIEIWSSEIAHKGGGYIRVPNPQETENSGCMWVEKYRWALHQRLMKDEIPTGAHRIVTDFLSNFGEQNESPLF